MKNGLQKIPSQKNLQLAYDKLQYQKPSALTIAELALFSQWVRFDPRLGEIWVKYVLEQWKNFNPVELHSVLEKNPWPATTAVLLEFVSRATSTSEKDAKIFNYWKHIVTYGFAKANWEQFFIGQRRIAGKAMFEDARFALAEYRKWGYLGREILFNKQMLPRQIVLKSIKKYARIRTHTIEAPIRKEMLKSLLEISPRISTTIYWNAIGRVISRRQAERDLSQNPLLRSVGQTKGRLFVKR